MTKNTELVFLFRIMIYGSMGYQGRYTKLDRFFAQDLQGTVQHVDQKPQMSCTFWDEIELVDFD